MEGGEGWGKEGVEVENEGGNDIQGEGRRLAQEGEGDA